MVALLEDALAAGALGMSSGLFTPPGCYAAPAEMIALGHVLKRHNAGYFTHLRDESNKVIEAVAEAIEIAQHCGVHVEIVHFKCSGMDNWGKAATALAMIADAKARGLDVDCDSYPYAAGSNPLKNLLPQWVQAGGVRGDAGAALPSAIRAKESAPTSRATASTIGAASRHGTACRSRSRRTCRSTPAAPSPRSRPNAAPTRSTRCAIFSPRTGARPACW